jgi:hypothetical protein
MAGIEQKIGRLVDHPFAPVRGLFVDQGCNRGIFVEKSHGLLLQIPNAMVRRMANSFS